MSDDGVNQAGSSTSPGQKPRDLTDTALRRIIRDAATQSRTGRYRTGARNLPLTPHPALVRSRTRPVTGPRIETGFALRKLPVAKASRPRMVAAALAFVAQWLIGTIAGVIYAHFEPGREEVAQFITLLLSSLCTFTCAVVAWIELFRFTRAGRSVAIGLALVNAFIYALLAFYARHWLLVAGQVVFAVGIALLLAEPHKRRRRTDDDGDTAPADGQSAVESTNPPARMQGRGTLIAGAVLILLAWCTLLVPAVIYRVNLQRMPAMMGETLKLFDAGRIDEAREVAGRVEPVLALLVGMSDLVGEKYRARGTMLASWGFVMALAGDEQIGFERVTDAYAYHQYGTIDLAYALRARVYCLREGLTWRAHIERDATPEEIERLEGFRPGRTDVTDELYFLQTGRVPGQATTGDEDDDLSRLFGD